MDSLITFMANILPTPPTGTPWQVAQDLITTMSLWVGRVGGFISWIGAVKFAIGLKSEDAKDQIDAVLIMISGFMIQMAINDPTLLAGQANSWTQAAINQQFARIMTFAQTWVGRAGGVTAFIGGIMLMLSLRDPDNSIGKINGAKTMAAGFVVASIALMLPLFVS